MVKKNFYLNYCNLDEVEIKSFQDIKNLEEDFYPKHITYQVISDYPVDFSNELLEKLAKMFPDVPIECQALNKNGILKSIFNWRIKKAFIETTDKLKVMSKCTRLKVCCLIVKDNRIISTGVNGTPRGYKNCNEVFSKEAQECSDFKEMHHQFSDKYEVHAEMNAILELGRNTSIDSYDDLEMFCSTCPCPGCAKMIAQSGIKSVYYLEEYDRMPEGAKLLQDFGVKVYKL